MRKLVYSMSASLDGFIAGPGGEIDWSVPDEELHRFHNDRMRTVDVQLCGRRLYEVMLFWETVEQEPSIEPVMLEFARIWEKVPKVVFSSTLSSVVGNATLATRSVAEEVAAWKQEPGEGLIEVGGAGLAASCIELIDEFQVFVNPVVLGAGTPYFPPLEHRLALELVETRTFGSRVVYLRYHHLRS